MICYVYYKESKMISCKIDNVEYINDSEKEIRGENILVKYGDGQDYICLESDTINKNTGDTINLDNLEDERSYFLFGKEVWMQEKINKLNSINTTLNDRLKTLETSPPLVEQMKTTNSDMNTALLGIADVYELLLKGGTTT
jgi:hypothetical protein